MAPTTVTPSVNDRSEIHEVPDEVEFGSLDSAGRRVGLHPNTLRLAGARGEFPIYKMGTWRTAPVRVRISDVVAWVESHQIPTATARSAR
jgi:hypothetical protein